MVQTGRVLEIGPIDGELVVRVELRWPIEVCCPGVRAVAREDIHAMVHGRTSVVAQHICGWRGSVVVWVRGEDDIPGSIDIVDFGRPYIGRKIFANVRILV